MKGVRSIVISGYGTNCEMEMACVCHHHTHHPRWTREELPEEGMGVDFFRNAVQYIRNHLL
jgi:hypothetical protein